MLDFNKMMNEINADLKKEGTMINPDFDTQQKELADNVNKINETLNNVSSEFNKKFEEMHELFFNKQNNDINTDGAQSDNDIEI